MEAWTDGKVSAGARKSYLAMRPWITEDRFIRIRGGYRFIGWESEIAMCRAMGRGYASGNDRPAHRFDSDHA